ncbi:hypothetical protein Q9Q94_08535 [Uliginosibacterium sp. 31-16]|uniref:hypothetical protein n=1 Tax=Uliginosibacterium sp. 31-16 TaxID=3068315 RepID=UPI00273D610F|nr:hypothetical protein [Uliginosibacterium sp. 31-16]MDP5239574.1 hypothetical protein [Uliginosibacterium sp. 31-16]
METEYRVVFAGVVLEGFDPEVVKHAASSRLKASPEQLERLFSGRTAVLKKGLNSETGARYVAELTRLGMQVKLEATILTTAASPVIQPPAPPRPAPSSDLEKTQVATPDALARYLNDEPDLSNAPTLVVPRTRVQELSRPAHAQDPSSAPTEIVPRDRQAEIRRKMEAAQAAAEDPSSAPTLIVPRDQLTETRRHLEQALAAQGDPSSAPTVIVPRSKQTVSGTVVVQQGAEHLRNKTGSEGKHDPERTLIANAGALEAYLAANTGASPMGNMTSTDIQQPAVQQEQGNEPSPAAQTTPPVPPRHPPLPEAAILSHTTPPTPADQILAGQSAPAVQGVPLQTFQTPITSSGQLRAELDAENDREEAKTGFAALSSTRQLLLITLGGGALLALVIWLTTVLE